MFKKSTELMEKISQKLLETPELAKTLEYLVDHVELAQSVEYLADRPGLAKSIDQLAKHPEIQQHITKLLEIASGPDQLRRADDAEGCIRKVSKEMQKKC